MDILNTILNSTVPREISGALLLLLGILIGIYISHIYRNFIKRE